MLIVNILQLLLLLGPSAIFISLLSNRVKIGPLIIILLVGLIFWPVVGFIFSVGFKDLDANAPPYAKGMNIFLASGVGAALSLIAGTVGMVVRRIVSKHW
jgi:hypothetical protein